MKRECEIIVLGADAEPKTAVVVALQDGKISAAPQPGFELLADGLLGRALYADGGKRRVFPKTEPEAWFEALPSNLVGTRLRARIVN